MTDIKDSLPNMDEVVRQVKEALEFRVVADIYEQRKSTEWLRLLIEEREQDKATIDRLSDLQLRRMEVEDGAINFHISGEAGMAFASILVRFFEDNGGKNFFSFDMKRGEEHFAINIQKVNGELSPTEMMNQQAARIAEQDKEIQLFKDSMVLASAYLSKRDELKAAKLEIEQFKTDTEYLQKVIDAKDEMLAWAERLVGSGPVPGIHYDPTNWLKEYRSTEYLNRTK